MTCCHISARSNLNHGTENMSERSILRPMKTPAWLAGESLKSFLSSLSRKQIAKQPTWGISFRLHIVPVSASYTITFLLVGHNHLTACIKVECSTKISHVLCGQNSELQAKILPYHRSKQLHAQQIYWQNALLLELREVKAREEQMCQSLWHSSFHQHYHTQFFWGKEPFWLRTWKIPRETRFYAHTVLQDNDLTSHRQRQNNSISLLSESDRDSSTCDCASLKSIMQTLELI